MTIVTIIRFSVSVGLIIIIIGYMLVAASRPLLAASALIPNPASTALPVNRPSAMQQVVPIISMMMVAAIMVTIEGIITILTFTLCEPSSKGRPSKCEIIMIMIL